MLGRKSNHPPARNDKNLYWFHAKSHGWGWGLPATWQGWLSLTLFLVVISGLPVFVDPNENGLLFLGAMLLASGILLGICYAKGEPPKWQWGTSRPPKK